MKTMVIVMLLAAIASATSPLREWSAESARPGEGDGRPRHADASFAQQRHAANLRASTLTPALSLEGRGGATALTRDLVAANIRFLSVDLIIDSKDQPLAVYQLDFTASQGVTIVGIEGGAHEAFKNPPYFDPAAIQHERVIIAAFSTAEAEKLPRGKTRVATIHLQITGDGEPTFELKPSVIATIDGKAIEASATVEPRRENL